MIRENRKTKTKGFNKSILIISAGFLAVMLVAAYVIQSYYSKIDSMANQHSVLFKIEDTTGMLMGKQFDVFLFDSIIYSDTLTMQNQQYLHTLDCSEKEQLITLFFHDIEATASEVISVKDTGTTYLMLKVLENNPENKLLTFRKFNF